MVRVPAKFGLYIIMIAIAVLLCGFGAVFIISETGAGKIKGYTLVGGGISFAILAAVLSIRGWLQMQRSERDPLELAEDAIEHRQRQRHNKAVNLSKAPSLYNALNQENSVTARQDARAKRVRDAHRHRKPKP